MPTPNIPDEVVEAMLEAWFSAPYQIQDAARMRLAAQAALPLLLEKTTIWAVRSELGVMYFGYEPTDQENREPLYRLKVSNEQ